MTGENRYYYLYRRLGCGRNPLCTFEDSLHEAANVRLLRRPSFKVISHTVEGEMGVADFILNFFKDRGVDLWLVLYGSAG